jgi:hypothetical protein
MMPLRKWRSRRGQSLVEFALILPVIMFLVLGMVELGFAINHNTSIITATRQGARVGAELRNGHGQCSLPDDAASQSVDPQIIGAVEGVLVSPGSPINVLQVTKIDIFEVDETGAQTTNINTWLPSSDPITHNPTGTILPGTSQHLYFAPSGGGIGGNWPAYKRCGSAPAHGVGVRITYTYKFITPLGALISALGGNIFNSAQIPMTDQTIMALEPPTP